MRTAPPTSANVSGKLISLPAVPTGVGTRFSWQREVDLALIPPREVRVWLPPDYSEDDGVGYPTLYCNDGQYIINSDSDSARSWHLDRAVTQMCRAGAIERPPVVVLIDNCRRDSKNRLGDVDVGPLVVMRRRWLEYGDGVVGRKYIAWLCDELKPSIDAQFNTQPGAESTSALGSSMGGLAAFLAVWWRPDVFGAAAALSPVFQDLVQIGGRVGLG
jgi:enterochelin esterase-like enzyme